jgi:uncharacterized protein (DUF302 family)
VTYYISKIVDLTFDEAVDAVTDSLMEQGFGILTEIDVQAKFKEKLGLAFRKYLILGACDPKSAYKALQAEDKIGVLLPCNVIVQETSAAQVEIAAMDPSAMMESIDNRALSELAKDVRDRLAAALDKV